MKYISYIILFTWAVTIVTPTNDSQPFRSSLEKSNIVTVEGSPVSGVGLPVKCDPDGNIVTRLLDGGDIMVALTCPQIPHGREYEIELIST